MTDDYEEAIHGRHAKRLGMRDLAVKALWHYINRNIISKAVRDMKHPHKVLLKSFSFLLFRPLFRGGGTIYSNVFFCSVNFGRSIYSSYRVETGIEARPALNMELKRFFYFPFFTGNYRGLKFLENRVISVDFFHFLRNFWLKYR